MYRDDLAATYARLEALQRDLSSAEQEASQDKQRIAMLTAQLQATQNALAVINSPSQALPPPWAQQPSFSMPPRGGTVLTLGILSLVMCTILGPFAWSMGTEELRRIDMGLTPPHQRGSAVAGRACGIVATCLMCFSLLMVMFILIAAPR